MSAGDSKVFLPSGAARGALRFQKQGVFRLTPSNLLGHESRTSHRQRCMSHCRSVFHWWDMSMNQSRTLGSAWTLRRFAVLPLGSSSTIAAAGVAEASRACLVANSDQQTGRWRPVRPARHRARRMPDPPTKKIVCWRSPASRSSGIKDFSASEKTRVRSRASRPIKSISAEMKSRLKQSIFNTKEMRTSGWIKETPDSDVVLFPHCDAWRMVGLAVLFVHIQGTGEISRHPVLQLQNTNDLAAQRCMTAEIVELARSEPGSALV